jgi:hypothetical protein
MLLLPGKSEGQDHNRQFIDTSGDVTRLLERIGAVETRLDTLKEKMEQDIESLVGRIAKLEENTVIAPAPTPVAEVVKGNFPAPTNQVVKSGGSNGSSSGGSSGNYQKVPQISNAPYANFPTSSGPHWTFPGSIENHLQSGHGINTSNMSRDQMLSLHDSLHEGKVSTTQPSPLRTTYSTRSSTCPNGANCPQNNSYSTTRRGIFNRWR